MMLFSLEFAARRCSKRDSQSFCGQESVGQKSQVLAFHLDRKSAYQRFFFDFYLQVFSHVNKSDNEKLLT
jgi:hypothetical protein